MHLSEQTKIGDCYLYQNFIEIRVYRCEFPPYRLPKFVPMRIFSLEYIRQMVHMDNLHFVAAKKNSQFKIKAQVGPFICNTKAVGKEANSLLNK